MNKQNVRNLFIELSSIDIYEVILEWKNGLKVRGCVIAEGLLPDREVERLGSHYAIIDEIEIIQEGRDGSIKFIQNEDGLSIILNLTTIPDKVMLEDGTVVWENNSEKA